MGLEGDKVKLVEDEFQDESLSDEDLEKVELHTLKVRRTKFVTFGALSQVVVFLMLCSIILGATMISLHMVAQKDPRWHTIMQVGLSITWISLFNLSAVILLISDKFLSTYQHPRLSEALVQCQFALGGIVGGWLTLCLTCYRPANVPADKTHSFMCRTMISTMLGIAIDLFLILRVVLPMMHDLN